MVLFLKDDEIGGFRFEVSSFEDQNIGVEVLNLIGKPRFGLS